MEEVERGLHTLLEKIKPALEQATRRERGCSKVQCSELPRECCAKGRQVDTSVWRQGHQRLWPHLSESTAPLTMARQVSTCKSGSRR